MSYTAWLQFIATTITLLFTQAGLAEVLFANNSLSLLSGNDYRLTPDNSVKIVTFEHASNYHGGDLFLFIDRFRYDSGEYSTYGEFSPRLSLVKSDIADKAVIKEILLAGTWEHGRSPGKDSLNNYLLGFGFDFNIPHTRYAKANVYYRDNDNNKNNWQLTLNFALPWQINNHHFLYDGFIDWTSSTSGVASSANMTTQLKWDISHYWQRPGQFYLGVEYVYWKNKYGLSGVDEHNPNLLLKFHF